MSGPDTLVERSEWLIRKGGYFYRRNWCGYTTVKAEAGRYTEAEARREAEIEPWHMSAIHQNDVPDPPEDANVDEIAKLHAELSALRERCETAERARNEMQLRLDLELDAYAKDHDMAVLRAARDAAVSALEGVTDAYASRYATFKRTFIEALDSSPAGETALQFIDRLTDKLDAAADGLGLTQPAGKEKGDG